MFWIQKIYFRSHLRDPFLHVQWHLLSGCGGLRRQCRRKSRIVAPVQVAGGMTPDFIPAQMRLDVCWRACGYSILPYFAKLILNCYKDTETHVGWNMWVGTVGGRFCRMHPRCAAAQIRPKELKCLQQQLLGMFVIKVIICSLLWLAKPIGRAFVLISKPGGVSGVHMDPVRLLFGASRPPAWKLRFYWALG